MKPPAPPEVCAVKMTLRAVSRAAREVRLRWYALRGQPPSTTTVTDIGATTAEMWAAERALASQAARWRKCLAAREAMPVAERWNLAALEKWACTVEVERGDERADVFLRYVAAVELPD